MNPLKVLKQLVLNLVNPYDSMIKEEGKSYSNLDYLIRRCENRMRIQPQCAYCKESMMFRRSIIVNSVPVRDDQLWKCPRCFHTTGFGLPISKREYDEEYKLRGGVYLMTPTFRKGEQVDSRVLERLRALGYID